MKGLSVLCGQMRQVLARPNGQKTLGLPGDKAARVSVGELGWLCPVEMSGGVEGHRPYSPDRDLEV